MGTFYFNRIFPVLTLKKKNITEQPFGDLSVALQSSAGLRTKLSWSALHENSLTHSWIKKRDTLAKLGIPRSGTPLPSGKTDREFECFKGFPQLLNLDFSSLILTSAQAEKRNVKWFNICMWDFVAVVMCLNFPKTLIFEAYNFR